MCWDYYSIHHYDTLCYYYYYAFSCCRIKSSSIDLLLDSTISFVRRYHIVLSGDPEARPEDREEHAQDQLDRNSENGHENADNSRFLRKVLKI
jgi:hypothetical protein